MYARSSGNETETLRATTTPGGIHRQGPEDAVVVGANMGLSLLVERGLSSGSPTGVTASTASASHVDTTSHPQLSRKALIGTRTRRGINPDGTVNAECECSQQVTHSVSRNMPKWFA